MRHFCGLLISQKRYDGGRLTSYDICQHSLIWTPDNGSESVRQTEFMTHLPCILLIRIAIIYLQQFWNTRAAIVRHRFGLVYNTFACYRSYIITMNMSTTTHKPSALRSICQWLTIAVVTRQQNTCSNLWGIVETWRHETEVIEAKEADKQTDWEGRTYKWTYPSVRMSDKFFTSPPPPRLDRMNLIATTFQYYEIRRRCKLKILTGSRQNLWNSLFRTDTRLLRY